MDKLLRQPEYARELVEASFGPCLSLGSVADEVGCTAVVALLGAAIAFNFFVLANL